MRGGAGCFIGGLSQRAGRFALVIRNSAWRQHIPKKIRDALKLKPGTRLEFAVNHQGEVVLHKAGAKASRQPSRFDQAAWQGSGSLAHR